MFNVHIINGVLHHSLAQSMVAPEGPAPNAKLHPSSEVPPRHTHPLVP